MESLEGESRKDLYQRRLKEKLVSNAITSDDEVEWVWEKVKVNINTASTKALGIR